MIKTRTGSPSPDAAQAMALNALTFLAAESENLDRLMTQSGLDIATLRARAGEPELLSAVLDFLLANEDLLLGFCEEVSADPKAVHMARHVLDEA